MKKLYTILIVLFSGMLNAQETEFGSYEEFVSYAYSNTNLSTFETGYLIDLDYTWTDEYDLNEYLTTFGEDKVINGDNLIQILQLMEKSDVTQSFEKDDYLFPLYKEFYSVAPEDYMDIPIFIFNMDMQRFKNNSHELIKNWSEDTPYPMFTENNVYTTNIQAAGPFMNNIINPKVRLYWSEDYFFTNKDVSVESVEVTINGRTFDLRENEALPISEYFGEVLNQIDVKVNYTNNTHFKNTFDIKIAKRSTEAKSSSDWNYDEKGTFWESENFRSQLNYEIQYGCGHDKLVKPFILVAGWGPYTSSTGFNNLVFEDKGVWPASIPELYEDFNYGGLITDLLDEGYDVVICKFFPPNEKVDYNSESLLNLIKHINEIKNENGSYEENIILGYSAGSIAARLALLKMEKRHLEMGQKHHQTKLYISFDGEHQGANIPLAAQHMVEHLEENSPLPNLGLFIYGMHYILNAPLSKELLHYFHTETGEIHDDESPNQDCHIMRDYMLNLFVSNNHSKNTHNKGYPSFTRNISIAQGAFKANISNGSNDQAPFAVQEGLVPFLQNALGKKHSSKFNSSGGDIVFDYKKKFLSSTWTIINRYKTNQWCLVLDNAPGGTVTVDSNPLDGTVYLMKMSFWGTPDVKKDHTQFCFTPTIFCHDIKNFHPEWHHYRLDYDMQANGLLFSSYNDYVNNQPSDFYGYPHIKYPQTHYVTFTPFDALYSSVLNEEHILCSRVSRSDLNDYSEPYGRYLNPNIDIMNEFCLEEADYFDAYIQNEIYGHFNNSTHKYKAIVQVPNNIYIGKNVTDRTDYKTANFTDQSEMTMLAGKEIVIRDGSYINKGSKTHLYIGPYFCEGKSKNSVAQNNDLSQNSNPYNVNKPKELKESQDWITVYPNPSTGLVNLKIRNDNITTFNYSVYNLNGVEVKKGSASEKSTQLNLAKGVYIIKINSDEKVYSKRVVII